MEQKNDRFAFKASDKRASALSALMGNSKSLPDVETMEMISLDLIDDLTSFEHPFEKSLKSESGKRKIEELAESIKTVGVLQPILVRPSQITEGRYEDIIGHKRRRAAKLAGLIEIPAIIKDCDDDEAKIIVTDNLNQRDEIYPSEKAKAYSMQLDAIKRVAGRPKNNFAPVGQNYDSRKMVAESAGESQQQIQRYLRLNEIIEPILDLIDDKEISLRAGVELSYLRKSEQEYLSEILMENKDLKISEELAKEIRAESKDMELSKLMIEALINPELEHKEEIIKVKKVKENHVMAFNSINKYIKKLESDKAEKLALVDQEELERKIREVIDGFIN